MKATPQILSKLNSLPRVQLIYQLKLDRNTNRKSLFIFILDKNCAFVPKELSLMLENIFGNETDYMYRVFPFEYARQQLIGHNLFFVRLCLFGRRVYSSSKEGTELFGPHSVISEQMKMIRLDFKKEMERVGNLMEGAIYLLEQGNMRQPALLFHQTVKLLFFKVALFMKGEAYPSQSLKEQQRFIKAYVPELGFLFNAEVEQEPDLLELLDEAYANKVDEHNYLLSKTLFQKIHENTVRMSALVSKLFADKLAECRSYVQKRETKKKIPFVQGNIPNSNIPSQEDDVVLDKIKALAKEHFCTLKRYPTRKELYGVSLITDGYLGASFMVSNLIKVCIMALEVDFTPTRAVPEPEHNVREVLGYILDLIPYEEMEFLDKIRDLFSES